jgi:pyridoxal phosphate enzyme (YggS family)
MNKADIGNNIAKLRERIRTGAANFQREDSGVRLLAVSKTRPAQAVRTACEAGIIEFGENYLSEALDKIAQLQDLPLCWHFIGPIQSNKTRPIAAHFDWVHSIDRLKIARRLNEARLDSQPPLQVCLQVNVSAETTKAGVSLNELPELARAVAQLPRLNLRGLMAIPRPTTDETEQRAGFRTLRLALEDLQQTLPGLDTLSMGMSADLEAAIAEGATIVRVGTDIFGPRSG